MHDDIRWEEHQSRIPGWNDSFKETLRLMSGVEAPQWTAYVGDRRTSEDEDFVDRFAEDLRQPWSGRKGIPKTTLEWAKSRMADTLWFRKNLSMRDWDEWEKLPCMNRKDLSARLAEVIPHNADLSRLVVNPTTGTAGQPLLCPNHPMAIGCYDAFFEYILELWGIQPLLGPGETLAVQVCYQAHTLTYATCHSRHKGAGFAKVNLHPSIWPKDKAQAWFDKVQPQVLTGDPWSFDRMIRLGLKTTPVALLSTSLLLEDAQRENWELYFGCPVIDLYSMNETGPLGVSLPGMPGVFHQLAHDLYLESSKEGELLVTGGRNPYLPLFRYQTGDVATFVDGRDGRPAWRLETGRKAVVWEKADGTETQPLELARILRSYEEVVSYKVLEASPGKLRLGLTAPSFASQDLDILAGRLASFWEGNLEAGKLGRHVDWPPPVGKVEIILE